MLFNLVQPDMVETLGLVEPKSRSLQINWSTPVPEHTDHKVVFEVTWCPKNKTTGEWMECLVNRSSNKHLTVLPIFAKITDT